MKVTNYEDVFGSWRVAYAPDEGGGASGNSATEAEGAQGAGAEPAEAVAGAVASTDTSAAASATPNWRDTVTDPELRSVAERFNSPADAIKAVADLRRNLSTAVKLPGKNASAEELQAFRKALGVPESPEGYKFEPPQGQQFDEADKALQGEFAKLMHQAGIPASAAEQFFKGYGELAAQQRQQQLEADKKFAEEASNALRQEWGDDYTRNLELAKRAASELFSENFENMTKLELSDGRFLLDHPDIVRLFARIGSEMAEGTIGPRLDPSEVSGIEQRIDDLGRQKMDALDKGDRAAAERLDQEQATLISKLSGNKPVVGAQGRAY